MVINTWFKWWLNYSQQKAVWVGELSCVNPPPHQVEHMALYVSLAVEGPAVNGFGSSQYRNFITG